MSDRRHKTVDRYVQRVLALRDEQTAEATAEELRAIALEIGLDEDDLAAVERSAADHFTRGEAYLEHERYADAITELEDAVALEPRRIEWLHALACAHAGRWRETGEVTHRNRAEALARRCLELDPRHSASIAVLDALDAAPERPAGPAAAPPVTAPPVAASRPTRSKTLLLGCLLLVLGAFGLVLTIVSRLPERSTPATGTAPAETPAPPAAANDNPPPAPAGAATELEIPVDFDPAKNELELEIRRSELASYPTGNAFYTLGAVLINRGDAEIDELGVQLELLDEGGEVIDRHAFDAVSTADATLRPRDEHAFHSLLRTRPGPRRARLRVVSADRKPAAGLYAAAEPIDFTWPDPRPSADVDVAIRERQLRFSEKGFADDGSGFFDLVVEVENVGQRTLRGLKLKADVAGGGGAWTQTISRFVTIPSKPAIEPGETRLVRFIREVPGRPDGYALSVVDAQ